MRAREVTVGRSMGLPSAWQAKHDSVWASTMAPISARAVEKVMRPSLLKMRTRSMPSCWPMVSMIR